MVDASIYLCLTNHDKIYSNHQPYYISYETVMWTKLLFNLITLGGDGLKRRKMTGKQQT